ncbi:MAG TPA: four helix bundle protein [Spongiibacteraceae bacterium]|nr:four helix bundle protein [Spongiibacteraceae bacterium]
MEIRRRYRQLKVWQSAMALVTEVYRVTGGFPETEKFGLVTQMRRAAVSLPSNIAEGAGRGTDKEFSRFLQIARGSLFELETQVDIARRLELIARPEELNEHFEHLFAMLNNLIQKLKP